MQIENNEIQQIPLPWKVIRVNTHKRPWLTVRKEKLEMPNGNVVPLLCSEYPNWVNIIAITKEGRFILVEQYRPVSVKLVLNFVPGYVKRRILSAVSAQRELLEEPVTAEGTGRNSCVLPRMPVQPTTTLGALSLKVWRKPVIRHLKSLKTLRYISFHMMR